MKFTFHIPLAWKTTSLLGLFFAISQVYSQTQPVVATDSGSNKDWLLMMQDPEVNFTDVQAAFYKYWNGRGDYKGNGWKVFKRWEYINAHRVLPNGRLQAPGYVVAEYDRYMEAVSRHKLQTRSTSGTWSLLGPTSYYINNTGQPTGMGRINAIAFHPSDASTIYVGSPGGGIWKTTNGGSSWSNINSNLPRLGVSSILVHPGGADTIFIGTGDRDGGDAPGIGVYKTTDGGLSWVRIGSAATGMGDVEVGVLLMHPGNRKIILAATSGGIYKSSDGGKTWSLKISGDFRDMKFNPYNPNQVYATRIASNASFYRSTDNGETWIQITSGISASYGSRMVLAVSPANASYVYLLAIDASTANFAALMRSTDSGVTFSTQSTSPNIMDYACNGSGTSSQATYDLCMTVDPIDANKVFVGSINNWYSTNGGTNWTISSHWVGGCAASVHADQHVYEWSPLNGRLYLGNDGGVYYTADGGTTWPQITNNLGTGEVYKIGQSATNVNYVLMGLQDNGCGATTNGSTFYTTSGGDGMETLVDYNNSNYCYNTYHSGLIRRTTGGPTGSYSDVAAQGTNGITESGAWVAPYFLHKTTPTTMFAGYKNVWRTTNVRSNPINTVVWEAISTGESINVEVLDQSPVSTNILYAVRSSGMKRSDNANGAAASVTWTSCALPGGYIPEDIKADPFDSNTVYAAANYGVYMSADKGMHWTDISSNLPALFTNCLALDKNNQGAIYVGNQTGVWYKNAAVSDWILFSTGLPSVDVRELEIYYDATPSNSRIRAATYGLGVWTSDLAEITVLNPRNFAALPASTSQINLSWLQNLAGNNVLIAVSSTGIFGAPASGTAYSSGNSIPGGGTVIYGGNALSFSHTGLTANTTYYYKIWSVNSSNQYSAGLPAISATTFGFNWTSGAGTTDWFTAGNWGNNQIPTSTNDIFIPRGVARYPLIGASGAVCRNIHIDTGASVSMSGGSAYTLRVSGDFTNNGTFTRGIGTVEFNGYGLQTIRGSSTTAFNYLVVNKPGISDILEVSSLITLNAASGDPLTVTSGIFKLSSASDITPWRSSVTIGNTAGFWNNGGTVRGSNGSLTVNGGILTISAGRMTVGTAANHYLLYLNNPKITISGGVLNLCSRFYPNSSTSSCKFNISGGTIVVNTLGSTSTTAGMFHLATNTSFTMSGGTIRIQRNCSYTVADVVLISSTISISGGTMQFGTAASPASHTFRLYSTVPLPTVVVDSATTPTLQLVNSPLTVNNDLQINKGVFSANNLNVTVSGNITNMGTWSGGNGRLTMNGVAAQELKGNSSITCKKFTLSNAAGLTFSGSAGLTVDSLLSFTAGSINTQGNLLIISDNCLISGAGSASYVNGLLRKVGDDAFTFPVGDGSYYAPLSISAPSQTTDHFTASYHRSTHSLYDTTNVQTPLSQINGREYWILDRTSGSSSVAVTLTWAGRSGVVSSLPDMLVGRWNGSQWVSEGVASYTGNVSAGSITSNAVNNFSPFTLGNFNLTPLSAQLLLFDAKRVGTTVQADWKASETAESKTQYLVEKSTDLKTWTAACQKTSDGYSTGDISYSCTDPNPGNSVVFYRLRQSEGNGQFTYSNVRVVPAANSGSGTVVFPNPASTELFVSTENPEFEVSIYNLQGALVFRDHNCSIIPVTRIPNGSYAVRIKEGEKVTTRQVLIQH